MKKGQTLVMLLVFVTVALTLMLAVVAVAVGGLQRTTAMEMSQKAHDLAEGGMENALIRLLRDPGYLGETLTMFDGQTTIEVAGSDEKTIEVEATIGNYVRRVIVTADTSSGRVQVLSWKESY